jgi:hypothetical protein
LRSATRCAKNAAAPYRGKLAQRYWHPEGEPGLASETDFLDMYRTLGLRPGCALPELKQAFRRHVARVHPDRQGGRAVDAAAAARLQRLIAQYDAAIAFEREHGRLPGSVTRVRFAVPEPAPAPAASPVFTPLPGVPRARPAWRHPLLALLLPAVLLGVLGWDIAGRPTSILSSASEPANDNEARPLGEASPVGALSKGMSHEDVRDLLGDPLSVEGDRWVYGPSWVRFDNNGVVDWYSSPLHALGTSTRTPDTPPVIAQP